MPVSPADLPLLSRLLDQALALAPAARAAWLDALQGPEAALRPALERALAQPDPRAPEPVPHLPDAPLAAGTRCGPYLLLAPLGQGGMGQVWLARRADGLEDREVALKLPRLAEHPGLAQRMARERLIAARLEHPHIARLYDTGVDPVLGPYLVMERVRGRHLLDHAQHHQLDRPQRLGLMLQACEAVAHAHRHLVVHRDLKPSNLMVDAQGQLKLLDFGVARLLNDEGAAPSAGSATLDGTGLTRTPRYAAPEQSSGGPITTATDVYALGAVLAELLAEPASAAPAPPELQAVLARATAPEPGQRHASVDALAADLRAVLAQRPPAGVSMPRTRRAHLWARRHRLGLALAVLLALGVATGSVLLQAERQRTAAQSERLNQVRLFMLTLFTDAEPRAGQGMDAVTAVDLLDAARERARTAFPQDPVLRAEVLNELAIMARRFDRPALAAAGFQDAHALMQAHAAPDDPGRAIVAAQWALESVAIAGRGGPEGDAALARVPALATGALQGCPDGVPRCAKAQAAAHAALRNRATLMGDGLGALREAEATVRTVDRAFPPPHAEGASARLQWAIVLRNEDRLLPAQAALAEANAIVRQAPLRQGDEQERLLVQAMLQGDLGQHPEALATLDALRAQLPPQAADHALLHRLRAQSLLALGRLPLALEAAAAGLEAARQHDNAWEQANTLAVRARALAAMGDGAGAQRAWQAWRAALGPGEPSALQAQRLRRAEAELALRQGDTARAQAWAQAADAVNGAPLERALDALLRATVARHAADDEAAHAALQQADGLLQPLLPPAHPLRLRLAFERALLQGLRQGGPADPALRQAGEALLATWPTDSLWHAAVRATLADPSRGRSLVL